MRPFDDVSFHQLALGVRFQSVDVQDSPPPVGEEFRDQSFVPHRWPEFLPICGLKNQVNIRSIVKF